MKKYLFWLVLRALVVTIQRVPLYFALKIGHGIGLFAYTVAPRRRRITMDNLKHAFPEKSQKDYNNIMFNMDRNLGYNIVEFLRLPIMKQPYFDKYIEFEGLENLDAALTKGKGVFILTAHFGNWDLVAASTVVKGYPINLVTKYLKNEMLNDLWLGYRKKLNVNIMYREGSLRQIIKHLKKNEGMGFVLDQNTRRTEGVFVNFFGRPACTIPSLATLAQRLETPVVPCFMIRKKGPYHKVVFEPEVPFEKKATLEETVVHNTQRYTDVIERYIRAYPDHWIWMHRRWKTQPR